MPREMNDSADITIKHELTAVLYKNFPINFFSTLFISSILFWELSSVIETSYINGWYVIFCLILILRLGLCIWFNYTKGNETLFLMHNYLFLMGSCMTAIMWGTLGSILMPPDFAHQALILIIVSGTFAGAVQSLGSDFKVCSSYVLIALIPILFWLFMQVYGGAKIYVGIFILMTLYTLYSVIIGYRYYAILFNNIKLHLKNAELFEDLKKHTSQIEFFSHLDTVLTTCDSIEEIATIACQSIEHIMPQTSGGFFMYGVDQEKLKAIKTWGHIVKPRQTIMVNQCHAILKQTIHLKRAHELCSHHHHSVGHYMCAPFKTMDKIYGMLTIAQSSQEDFSSYQHSMIVRITNDITAAITRLELRDTLKSQAMHDFLTGLYNKRYLSDFLKKEISRVKRKKKQLAIMMIDVDYFKNFNDHYGHEVGDSILQAIGFFISKNTRIYDTACRYGGEEFVIIMSDTSLETALKRAEHIRQGVKELAVKINDQLIGNITLSIGVAVYPSHGTTGESVLDAADHALYQAKNEGRDRVCAASPFENNSLFTGT